MLYLEIMSYMQQSFNYGELIMKICFIGDVHGKFYELQSVIPTNCDLIIQLGDFGYGFFNFPITVKKYTPTIYFIDGNHDNHEILHKYTKISEIHPGLNYIPRGTYLKDYGILCIGGAESIDKELRTEGFNWWCGERITIKNYHTIMNNLNGEKPNIIVSHDAPSILIKNVFSHVKPNSSTKILDNLLEELTPNYWFFAHHHYSFSGIYKNTKYTCLDELETVQLNV